MKLLEYFTLILVLDIYFLRRGNKSHCRRYLGYSRGAGVGAMLRARVLVLVVMLVLAALLLHVAEAVLTLFITV